MFFVFEISDILTHMFGLTSQPQRNSSGRITSNPHEDIRRGGSSSTYDASAAERMKMEYLKKERERRDKERNKMLYDGKKREYDRLIDEEARMKIESRRLESELVRYTHEVEGIKTQEAREKSGLPAFKKEELELMQKIQKTESELLSYKNRHQKVQQEISRLEQSDKSFVVDINKRETYVSGLKLKFEAVKRTHDETVKKIDKLKAEVEQLHRLII